MHHVPRHARTGCCRAINCEPVGERRSTGLSCFRACSRRPKRTPKANFSSVFCSVLFVKSGPSPTFPTPLFSVLHPDIPHAFGCIATCKMKTSVATLAQLQRAQRKARLTATPGPEHAPCTHSHSTQPLSPVTQTRRCTRRCTISKKHALAAAAVQAAVKTCRCR